MKKLLLLSLSVILLSLPMFGQNFKGQNNLIEGENEYRFFVKIRPEALIDIEASKVLSFSKLRNSELNDILEKLNEYDFSQLLDFDKNERSSLRLGKEVLTSNGFNKTEFSGLLQMQGSQYIDKYELLALANELEKYEIVEYCEISPITPTPPPGATAMPMLTRNAVSTRSETSTLSTDVITPDFEGRQSYLFGYKDKDIHGIYVDYAWSQGITGQGVTIADIEWGWTYTHEDFVGQNVIDGFTTTNHKEDSHGTSVMGEMYAAKNEYGVTGGVYGADAFYGFSEIPLGREKAIAMALDVLQPGDVLVYEMQRGGADDDGYVPADYAQTVWDLTKSASEAGIIVVAAAGNGNVNLDGSKYAAYRNRGDNGSILVGAATMDGRDRCSFSTYGSMVKLCGIGGSVTSTGGSDLFYNGVNSGYTASFSGTSSSTPIVASAVVAIQSYAKNKLGYILSPAEMRDLLYETGTPASGSWGLVTPKLPNVKNAIKKLDPNVLDNKYTLTVVNGIGSGFYKSGEEIIIKPAFVQTSSYLGKDSVFSHWEFTQGSAVIENVTANTSRLIMPSGDVTVTPRYKGQNKCILSLNRATYAVGEEMIINFLFSSNDVDPEIELSLISELGDRVPLGKRKISDKQFVTKIPTSVVPDLSYLILCEFVDDGQTVRNTSGSFIISYPNSDYYIIPSTDTSIHSVSSEQSGAEAAYTLDGNPLTHWNSKAGYPHEIVFKLNKTHKIAGLLYLPVQVGNAGMIKECEVYTSTDGESWGTVVGKGSWAFGYTEQKIVFTTPQEGQYLKIKVISDVTGTPYAAISEVSILGARDVKLPTCSMTFNRSYYRPGEEATIRWSSNVNQQVNLYLVRNGVEKAMGTADIATSSRQLITSIPADCDPGKNYRIAVEFVEADNYRYYSSPIDIVEYDKKHQVVPRTRTSVHSFINQNNKRDGAATNVIDANENTYWHTIKSDPPKHPHYIVLQIDSIYELTGLIYVPRQNGTEGRIVDYEIYTSLDPESWSDTPVASGAWSGTNKEEIVFFENIVKGQYVKLVSLSEVNGKDYTSVAELLLLHTNTTQSGVDRPVEDAVLIYPNPARDFIYVKGVAEDEIVKIMNISGQSVYEVKISKEGQIDISYLPQGVYLIKIGDVVKKMIKQ